MPSAIWTGSISFGLVTVPVRLVSATRSQDVRFNQLEADTGARIRYRRVSEQTGEEVPNDQIVKGYEIEPGRYVVVEADELAALKPKASHTIEIEDFVDLAEIDPIYFEQPYYLIPDKDAAKPYRLLIDAMEDEGKVAIGRFVLRSKEALVAIRPVDGVLCLETMRYADEVLAADREQPVPERRRSPPARELTMARQLVRSLAATFDPRSTTTSTARRCSRSSTARRPARRSWRRPAAEAPAKVLDLMAALEASLARTGGERPAPAAKQAPARQAGRSKTGSSKTGSSKTGSAKTAAKKSRGKKAAPAKRARKSA